MNSLLLAVSALVPAMIGPLPAEERTLTVTLCGSGKVIEIDLGDPAPVDGEGACHQSGCHAGCSRKKIDRGQ
ncbi:hypothetical protein [Qipengyuania aquimaris]|uniref:Uncharacterized protein n=1 Tax=Qipengyuania aquimaris TaxID=255984 RepID=A0A9Q3S1G6_9SPHN|nr:hypothetical protein [Qipengyuania aquimaris]MBY6218070.1 hypothetical protein [Qipengyuania aquimaris]